VAAVLAQMELLLLVALEEIMEVALQVVVGLFLSGLLAHPV
jgi:hypothetical protein